MVRNYIEMKSQAISTNYYLIGKMVEENGLTKYNNDDFIFKAAKWSFRKYGYGRADLAGYIEFFEVRRTNRLYDIDVKLWYKLLKLIFKRDNWTCQYCGKRGEKLEGDHIIPISKGGTNEITNLATSCRRCNRQKKDKTIKQFNEWKKNAIH